MNQLKITKSAAKTWNSLDAKQYKQIGKTILGLLDNPTPHDSQTLKGAKHGERRVDIGEYRIIYTIVEDVIEVLVVDKRNDGAAYKLWAQR
jgi:mRNA interferase RelE/StbE